MTLFAGSKAAAHAVVKLIAVREACKGISVMPLDEGEDGHTLIAALAPEAIGIALYLVVFRGHLPHSVPWAISIHSVRSTRALQSSHLDNEVFVWM